MSGRSFPEPASGRGSPVPTIRQSPRTARSNSRRCCLSACSSAAASTRSGMPRACACRQGHAGSSLGGRGRVPSAGIHGSAWPSLATSGSGSCGPGRSAPSQESGRSSMWSMTLVSSASSWRRSCGDSTPKSRSVTATDAVWAAANASRPAGVIVTSLERRSLADCRRTTQPSRSRSSRARLRMGQREQHPEVQRFEPGRREPRNEVPPGVAVRPLQKPAGAEPRCDSIRRWGLGHGRRIALLVLSQL